MPSGKIPQALNFSRILKKRRCSSQSTELRVEYQITINNLNDSFVIAITVAFIFALYIFIKVSLAVFFSE